MNTHDSLFISKHVIKKIILIVVAENKSLDINQSALNSILQKTLVVNIKKNNHLTLSLSLETKNLIKIKDNVEKLQADIKEMIEHITDYKVDAINVNLIG